MKTRCRIISGRFSGKNKTSNNPSSVRAKVEKFKSAIDVVKETQWNNRFFPNKLISTRKIGQFRSNTFVKKE